ncbi:MAG: hypothetical protein NTZ18_04525 [Candidatus Komeilibacteria bacterium]|nr:hypothetical protein [Candidatus Komeilibacteria bacterium]
MDSEQFKFIAGKLMIVVFITALLIGSIIYLNQRWERIRDIRRMADTQSVIKALEFYNVQLGHYPDKLPNDGDGWNKSNTKVEGRFLEPLVKIGLLPALVFDPLNNATYYYRYQRFASGSFGCSRNFAVFQVTDFEANNDNHGQGRCPGLDFSTLAPNGFTWFALD